MEAQTSSVVVLQMAASASEIHAQEAYVAYLGLESPCSNSSKMPSLQQGSSKARAVVRLRALETGAVVRQLVLSLLALLALLASLPL